MIGERLVLLPALVAVVLGNAACVLGDVDLNNRSCPCAAGWVCQDDVCVPSNRARRDPPPDGGPVPIPKDDPCYDEHPDAIFCDGFEDPSLSAWAEERRVSGDVVHVTDRVRSGSGAIKAVTAMNGGRAALVSPMLDLSGTNLYFRTFVYVESGQSLAEASLAVVREAELAEVGVALQIYNNVANLWVGPASGSKPSPASMTLPRDQWACLEGHVLVDAEESGSAEYWIDGDLAVALSNVRTRPEGGFDQLVLGVEYSSPSTQGPITIWYDDVVVSDSRIGCD